MWLTVAVPAHRKSLEDADLAAAAIDDAHVEVLAVYLLESNYTVRWHQMLLKRYSLGGARI